jgi:hypothetical protein
MTTTKENAPALVAYFVTERGDKSFWTRIGAAWVHDDGKGYGLRLDLVPALGAAGRIVLREKAPAGQGATDDGAGA